MGLFDFFKRRRETEDEPEVGDKKIASLGKKAADKRAQAYDRDEALRALIDVGTPGAALALLKRFNVKVDPSITDQEEKQLAFEGIVSIGRGERGKRVSDEGKDEKETSSEPLTEEEIRELRDSIVGHTRDYCQRIDNLTWPIKILRALLDDEEYEKELLELLSQHDTEYVRNVEPKLNILAAMEDIKSEAVRAAVEPYLDDVNETVRFHAVQTTFEQDDPQSIPALVSLMKNEESVRVKNKVSAGIRSKDWKIPESLREDMAEAMRDVYEYQLTGDGKIDKR